MDPAKRRTLRLCTLGAGASLAGCTSLLDLAREEEPADPVDRDDDGKIDDWQYDPASQSDGKSVGGNATAQMAATASGGAGGAGGASDDLGFAVGGASNIATFRRNIEEDYLPLPQSLAYEGLFYNYYFDTGGGGACDSLFCPSSSTAVTADPLGGETERFLTVGLNSNLDTDSFERKALNLVVVLDISGSMGSAFDQYYYDRYGNRHEVEGDDDRSKMAVAKDALVSLTEQLRPGDRFGVVLFNEGASTAKPLRAVEDTDMDAIRGHIQEDIAAGGSTNLDAGMETATEMLGAYSDADQTETETRQIVITDAMPNTGQTDDQALRDRLSDYADDTIHTSFVGVGVDFNPALVDQITAVEGANYRSVHSAEKFETYLGEEFEYMVTPLVYDLSVELDAEGYDIAQVYGSSTAEDATDELLSVNTLFPSPQEGGRTRGGVVLVQVDRLDADSDLTLRASWEDRTGARSETTKTVSFPTESPEHFANSGIRKAVLLARYADLLQNWLAHEREPRLVDSEGGIGVPPEEDTLGEWEQQSQDLSISSPYDDRISEFRAYFQREMEAIGDGALQQELDTMDQILAADSDS